MVLLLTSVAISVREFSSAVTLTACTNANAPRVRTSVPSLLSLFILNFTFININFSILLERSIKFNNGA